jgi:hypothetical protein
MPSSIAFSTTLCESRHEGGMARRGNLKWLRHSRACGLANNVDDIYANRRQKFQMQDY